MKNQYRSQLVVSFCARWHVRMDLDLGLCRQHQKQELKLGWDAAVRASYAAGVQKFSSFSNSRVKFPPRPSHGEHCKPCVFLYYQAWNSTLDPTLRSRLPAELGVTQKDHKSTPHMPVSWNRWPAFNLQIPALLTRPCQCTFTLMSVHFAFKIFEMSECLESPCQGNFTVRRVSVEIKHGLLLAGETVQPNNCVCVCFQWFFEEYAWMTWVTWQTDLDES